MKQALMCFVMAFSAMLSTFSVDWEPEWALTDVDAFGDFHDGLAMCGSINNNFGYIDNSGEISLPSVFKRTGDFIRGHANVTDSLGRECIIDMRGNILLIADSCKFRPLERAIGFYKVEDKRTKLYSLSDGFSMLSQSKYNYINDEKYPFIEMSYTDEDGKFKSDVLNLLNNDFFEGSYISEYGSVGYKIDGGAIPNFVMYSFDGNPLDIDKLLVSDKGNEVYEDESTGRFGLRNLKTKEVILPARHKSMKNFHGHIWDHNLVQLFDSINPKETAGAYYNEDGKVVIPPDADYNLLAERDFIDAIYNKDYSDMSKWRYYDYNGNEIKSLKGCSWMRIAPGIYIYPISKKLYNTQTGKVIDNIKTYVINDGMARHFDSNNKYYYVNVETGKRYGPYDYAEDFNEDFGVAKVGDKKFLVDKNGVCYYPPDEIRIEGDRVSEGVIRAAYNGQTGYVYKPGPEREYPYNQKGDGAAKIFSRRCCEQAKALFDQERYAQAMDKYYQVLTADPENNIAFDNYACCLYNMGRYDEAITAVDVALDFWPDDDYAIDLRGKIVNALERQEADEESDNSTNYSVWDALGRLSNTLMSMAGQMGGEYVPYYGGGASSSSPAPSGNYQSQYDHWARRAQQNYESLTNLGYSVTSKSGRKSGGTGKRVSSGNYVQQKRTLREAQNEMRRIRRKAASEGVAIQKSPWEDASVGY